MQQPMSQSARSYFDQLYARRRRRVGGESTVLHYDHNSLWQHYTRSIQCWVAEERLYGKRVIEIECGLGLLQDIVNDYVGIDIARSSGAYLHQPFINASATALPFADNSFGGHQSLDAPSTLGSLFLRHTEPLRFRKSEGAR